MYLFTNASTLFILREISKIWEVDVTFCTSFIFMVVKVCNFHCSAAPRCVAAWMMLLRKASLNVGSQSLFKCGKDVSLEHLNSTGSNQFNSHSKLIPRHVQFSQQYISKGLTPFGSKSLTPTYF